MVFDSSPFGYSTGSSRRNSYDATAFLYGVVVLMLFVLMMMMMMMAIIQMIVVMAISLLHLLVVLSRVTIEAYVECSTILIVDTNTIIIMIMVLLVLTTNGPIYLTVVPSVTLLVVVSRIDVSIDA